MSHTLEHTLHNLRAEHAQTLAEYAILAGGIAVTVALTLPFIARSVTGLFQLAVDGFGG
jgi:Flp pilus assembly pilin Flp